MRPPDLPVGRPNAPVGKQERRRHERDDQEKRQRQDGADVDHEREHADELEHVRHRPDDAFRNELLQRIHVRRHPRHQAANGRPIEILQMQIQRLAEHVVPDVADDPLPHPGGDDGLEIAQHDAGQANSEKERPRPQESVHADVQVQSRGAEPLVDGVPDEDRRNAHAHAARDGQDQERAHDAPVGPGIDQQPAQQAEGLARARDLGFRGGIHRIRGWPQVAASRAGGGNSLVAGSVPRACPAG